MTAWPINDKTSEVFPLYSRANVGEIFPNPISPLNASAGFQHNLEPGWRDAFVACGVWDHDLYDESTPMNILPAFNSYLYINMSLMRLFGVRVPGMSAEAVDLQYFGDMPGIPSYESERRDFDENPEFEAKAGAWLVNEVLGATNLAAYDQDRAAIEKVRAERPDLTQLSDADLIARITSFDGLLRPMFQHHIEASLKAGVGLGATAQLAQAVGRPELALALVSGIGDVDSTGPSTGIWALGRKARVGAVAAEFDKGLDGLFERINRSNDPEVAAFAAELAQFLNEWDFRGPSEWEIRAETWGVDPGMVLATVDRMRGVVDTESPEAKNAEQAAGRDSAAATIRAMLAADPEASGQFEAVFAAAALWLRGRERGRTTAAMTMHEIRLAALELGHRFARSGQLANHEQVFMLFADELEDFRAEPHRFVDTLAERERSYLDLFDIKPPFVVAGAPTPLAEWERISSGAAPAPALVGEVLQGVSGCNGVVRGRARVILNPDDPGTLEPGDILVAPITDPSWTPIFMAAGGVIVDVGAPFSHAAIVSRELGIPCVVSAPDATKRIQDGAIVEVNGTTGAVAIVEAAPTAI